MGEAIQNPIMIEVDLCCMITQGYKHHPEHHPMFLLSATQPTIAEALNLHIEEVFKQVQWTLPHTFNACLPAQHPQEETTIQQP